MSAAPTLAELRAEHSPADLRRAARWAYWRGGDLSYYCSEIQLRFRDIVYNHPARRAALETCRRFGKTRTLVGLSGEWAMAFPGVRIPYAAPTGKQVKTFVHPHMRKLTEHAPDDIAPHINGDGEWVFPPLQWLNADDEPVRTKLHGGVRLVRFEGREAEAELLISRVAPHGCEDRKKADALRGTGTVLAIVDEARDIGILNYVLSSCLGPMLWEARSEWSEDVDPKMLVASTPADDPDHPFPDVADAAKHRGAYMHATVYDCDHLSERDIADAIEEAGGEHTVAWQVEGLAKRVRDPKRAVFPEFDAEGHAVATEHPRHFRPCVVGDGGHIDMALYGFGYFDFARDTFVLEDELTFRRTRSDITDEAIAAKEAELWGDRRVQKRRVDAPPQVRSDMNRDEWGEPGRDRANAPHWAGVAKPTGSMQKGVNRVRVLLSGKRLEIHPRCTTTIAHLNGARWNRQRSEFMRIRDEKGEVLHHYDGAAMAVYFVRECDTTNPYPVLEHVTSDYHVGPNAGRRTEAQVLTNLLYPKRRK